MKWSVATVLLALGLCLVARLGQSEPAPDASLPRVPPRSAAEAARSFQTADGFRMELLAAEPLVNDPVALEYDENGRAWVVEMTDYPFTDKTFDAAWEDQRSPGIGRIRILEDVDQDGRFDKSDVFAEGLSWPTGIALWKGGAFVAATPDVLYIKDTDGDGRADVRRTVFTGFRKFNVQAVINNLKWGLDHKIYGAGGSNGGDIRPGDMPEAKPVEMRRNDFSIDPVRETFELTAGGERFGNTFDDWGNRFICNIRNPVMHVVLAERHLARNPFLPVRTAVHDVAASGDTIPVYGISPPEPWRAVRAARWVATQADRMPQSELVAQGYFTSTSGITIYRGSAYPEAYRGNVFVGEVAGNLIHRQVLSPAGPTFSSRRVEKNREFVASSDNWFRPVNFVNAPDGTLHVVDMYRETIEHPWSIPDDIKEQLFLTSGRDRGRIWRLVPGTWAEDYRPPPRPRLGEATIDELVETLADANSWWRETAHRLIYERQDRKAVDPLRKMLYEHVSPFARLHAMWSLEGLEALDVEDLGRTLADAAPQIRQHAVHIAEPQLNDSPELLKKVAAMAHDPDLRVRFQVALSLGETPGEQTAGALAEIARRDAGDPWMRTAVLSSVGVEGLAMLNELLGDARLWETPGGIALLDQLAMLVAARNRPGEVAAVLERLASDEAGLRVADSLRFRLVGAIGEGLRHAGSGLADYAERSGAMRPLIAKLVQDAKRVAADDAASADERMLATGVLGFGPFERVNNALSELLRSQQPQAVQLASVRVLSQFRNEEVPGVLLSAYRHLTPALRGEVLEALAALPERIGRLLDAIEQGMVPLGDVPVTRRALFGKHRDESIRSRAAKIFSEDRPGPRADVLAEYKKVLAMAADENRGREIFKRECLACHKLGQQGHEVGPNLLTVTRRTADELLTHILDPNREVSPNFVEYLVLLSDGRTATGVIAEETATSLTLRRAEDQRETILRKNIDQIVASGKSLMPEGIEKKIPPQEMADLLAFLLSRRP